MACYGPAELAEELACPICFEDYDFQDTARIPTLLDCRHTFCGPCIRRSLEEDGSLECCICRLIHKNVNPTELIHNYVITNHLRNIQEQNDHDMALQLQRQIDRIEEENRSKEHEEKRKQEEQDAAVARKQEEKQQRALERASSSSSSQTPADVAVQQHLGKVLSDESFDSVVAFIEQITEIRLDKDLGKQRLQEMITQQQKQLLEDAESQQALSMETTKNNQIDPVASVDIDSVDGDEDVVPNDNGDEEDEFEDSDLESNESFHTVEEDNPNESVLFIETKTNNISNNVIFISDSEAESESDNENNNKDSVNGENISVVDLENNENIPPINLENIENIPPIISDIAPRPPIRRSKRVLPN